MSCMKTTYNLVRWFTGIALLTNDPNTTSGLCLFAYRPFGKELAS